MEAFVAAWHGDEPPPEGLGDALAAACGTARTAYPELVFDDRVLVEAIAVRCPSAGALAHVKGCYAADLALARAAARGDATAITLIEHTHRAMIDSICKGFTATGHSLDDLRQLLRAKLFAGHPPGIDGYAGQGQIASWLRVAATRLFIDLGKRKDRARETLDDDDGAAALLDPLDLGLELIKREYRAAVRAAIQHAARRLEPGDRHILRQHFVGGLTIDQLAAVLGIHRATAARRITRAREQLATMARDELATTLAITPQEVEEVVRLVVSRFDVSISQLLVSNP